MAHENAKPRPWASWGKPSREIGHADVDRWSLVGGKRPIIDGYIITEEDATLIVEAVNAYDTLRAENERLREALRAASDKAVRVETIIEVNLFRQDEKVKDAQSLAYEISRDALAALSEAQP